MHRHGKDKLTGDNVGGSPWLQLWMPMRVAGESGEVYSS